MNNSGRPLVTFALIAYNQEQFVGEAISAALAQSYSPLEIILSDDCSNDKTFEIMQLAAERYVGPHRVILNRNAQNLNIGNHINKIAKLASGKFIVFAAGDDISLPVRTEKLLSRWLELGCPPSVICSDFDPIDATSKQVHLPDETIYRGPYKIETMAQGNIHILGATTAISKNVFDSFPPMHSAVIHEDRVLPFRVALLGGTISLIDEKLIRYRVTGGVSRGHTLTARDFLFKQLPAQLTRMLPDALQRLADLEFMKVNDRNLRKHCIATIVDHESCIDLVQMRGFGIEATLLKALWRGARINVLLKLYLKLRLYFFFDLYFHWKYRQ